MSTSHDIELIREDQTKILENQIRILAALNNLDAPLVMAVGTAAASASTAAASVNASLDVLERIAKDIRLLREKFYGVLASDVTGISVTQDGEKETPMASKFKVVSLKALAAAPRAATKQAAPKLGTTFGLVDTKPGTFTTMGLDSETPPVAVDISTLATQTVVSADPNVTAVVTGMSVALTSASGTSGTAQVTWTISANDGSFSFSFVGACPYSGGPITGVQITQVS